MYQPELITSASTYIIDYEEDPVLITAILQEPLNIDPVSSPCCCRRRLGLDRREASNTVGDPR